MKQIRIGTFETNSSSTHSLVVCTEEEYNKWLEGEILVTDYGDIVTKEQYEKEQSGEYFDIAYDYESWWEYLEKAEYRYTTTKGENLVIVSAYGYDS